MRVLILVLLIHTISGKIFRKCELAAELKFKHNFSSEEVKKWVCIAEYESTFNTEAINEANWDGSKDYGLFQLNNRYWCGNEYGRNVCGISCQDLLDDDLTDDIKCANKIVRDTKRWMKTKDGLVAWVAYVKRCQHRNLDEYILECEDELSQPPEEEVAQTEPSVPDVTVDEKPLSPVGESEEESEGTTPPRVSGLGQVKLPTKEAGTDILEKSKSTDEEEGDSTVDKDPEDGSLSHTRVSGIGNVKSPIKKSGEVTSEKENIAGDKEPALVSENQPETLVPMRASALGHFSPLKDESKTEDIIVLVPTRASGLGTQSALSETSEDDPLFDSELKVKPLRVPPRASGLGSSFSSVNKGDDSNLSNQEEVEIAVDAVINNAADLVGESGSDFVGDASFKDEEIILPNAPTTISKQNVDDNSEKDILELSLNNDKDLDTALDLDRYDVPVTYMQPPVFEFGAEINNDQAIVGFEVESSEGKPEKYGIIAQHLEPPVFEYGTNLNEESELDGGFGLPIINEDELERYVVPVQNLEPPGFEFKADTAEIQPSSDFKTEELIEEDQINNEFGIDQDKLYPQLEKVDQEYSIEIIPGFPFQQDFMGEFPSFPAYFDYTQIPLIETQYHFINPLSSYQQFEHPITMPVMDYPESSQYGLFEKDFNDPIIRLMYDQSYSQNPPLSHKSAHTLNLMNNQNIKSIFKPFPISLDIKKNFQPATEHEPEKESLDFNIHKVIPKFELEKKPININFNKVFKPIKIKVPHINLNKKVTKIPGHGSGFLKGQKPHISSKIEKEANVPDSSVGDFTFNPFSKFSFAEEASKIGRRHQEAMLPVVLSDILDGGILIE